MPTMTCDVSGTLLDEGMRTGPMHIILTRTTGPSGETASWYGEPVRGIPGSNRPRLAVLEIESRPPVQVEIENFQRFHGIGPWPLD
jgi:hypothetical protein